MKLKYKKEIDGLRGIAILLVLFYHLEIQLLETSYFRSGYIGVDIFFVISGYLITRILIKEIIFEKNFSLTEFYKRRIRRIFPNLLFVSLIFIILSWFILLPQDYLNLSKTIIFSLNFLSNYYYWYSGFQYGSEITLEIPFLHTWSLSIEEQFYIFFPILLVFISKFNKVIITALISFIAIFSIILMLFLNSKGLNSATFYFFPTRIWEILLGSVLVFIELYLKKNSKNNYLKNLLSIIGFFIIIIFCLLSENDLYLGTNYTLIPLSGVCLVILFSTEANFTNKILISKFLSKIGLISYSIYLWHYPILSLIKINNFLIINNYLTASITLIVIWLLSVFSFKFIETPFRKKKYNIKKIFYKLFFFFILINILCFAILFTDGFKFRFHEILNIENNKKLRSNVNFRTCESVLLKCEFNSQSNKKVFLIGDSMWDNGAHDLKQKLIKQNYSLTPLFIGGCFFYPGFNLITYQKISDKCNNKTFEKIIKLLNNYTESIIIFHGRYTVYFKNEYFDNSEGGLELNNNNDLKAYFDYESLGQYISIEESFIENVKKLQEKNKIILIYPVPEAGWHVPRKLFQTLPAGKKKIDEFLKPQNYISTSYKRYLERNRESFKILDSIEGRNIYRVYPHKIFCNTQIKGRCLNNNSTTMFYSDSNHLSVKGARLLNEVIMDKINSFDIATK